MDTNIDILRTSMNVKNSLTKLNQLLEFLIGILFVDGLFVYQ